MEEANNYFGRVMHIDMSTRFYQRGRSGVAFKMIDNNFHKGMCLSARLKKELNKYLGAKDDFPRLYAICIYYLIKDMINEFDTLIICNDECFLEVKLYLDILFRDNKNYFNKKIVGLNKLREIMADPNLRSYADNIANIYRKKALLKIQRRQKGIPLNIININYTIISKKWIEINNLL